MDTTNLEVTLSQYYGAIYLRLYDTKLKKNVAKLEANALLEYLTKKVKTNKFKIVEQGKGNSLTVIRIK